MRLGKSVFYGIYRQLGKGKLRRTLYRINREFVAMRKKWGKPFSEETGAIQELEHLLLHRFRVRSMDERASRVAARRAASALCFDVYAFMKIAEFTTNGM